jgi:hypothetical protein
MRWRWHRRGREIALPAAIFVGAFAGTLYAATPGMPGMRALREVVTQRTNDQHYGGCEEARAANHENIYSWEPSYRVSMDRDGDGVACEPYP